MDRGDNHEWFLWVDETPRPGWANMAIDQTLLDRAGLLGENWLRLYAWEPHCLSFGRHEPATRRYDAARIAALGIDTVRRPTGGRAVWHGHELTYAVAAPGPRFGSLQEAYLEIHAMIGQALGKLGIEAVLASSRRSEPLDAGACFSRPAGGEVLVGGCKGRWECAAPAGWGAAPARLDPARGWAAHRSGADARTRGPRFFQQPG